MLQLHVLLESMALAVQHLHHAQEVVLLDPTVLLEAHLPLRAFALLAHSALVVQLQLIAMASALLDTTELVARLHQHAMVNALLAITARKDPHHQLRILVQLGVMGLQVRQTAVVLVLVPQDTSVCKRVRMQHPASVLQGSMEVEVPHHHLAVVHVVLGIIALLEVQLIQRRSVLLEPGVLVVLVLPHVSVNALLGITALLVVSHLLHLIRSVMLDTGDQAAKLKVTAMVCAMLDTIVLLEVQMLEIPVEFALVVVMEVLVRQHLSALAHAKLDTTVLLEVQVRHRMHVVITITIALQALVLQPPFQLDTTALAGLQQLGLE